MPRPPSSPHPLREIRDLAGVTQKQLATWIGVSTATIQSIELGRLKMSREVATKIMRQMGCGLHVEEQPEEKREYCLIPRYRYDISEPYSRTVFKEYRESLKKISDEGIRELSQAASRCIHLLLHSAARHNGGTFMALREDLETFASRIFNDYNLAPFLQQFLREEYNGHPDAETIAKTVRSFPASPLNTASAFPTEFEKDMPEKERRRKKIAL